MSVAPQDDEVYTGPDGRISQKDFMAIAWALTAVSLLFSITRLTTRLKLLRKLSWDDYLASFAWVLLLVFTIIWQVKIDILYWQFDVASGRKLPTPEFLTAFATFMPQVATWFILFYCCLWSIKFSCLVFFRPLSSKFRAHRAWWWVVTVVTFAGLIACLPLTDFGCTSHDISWIMTECSKASRVHAQLRQLYALAAIDILTDILVLSIPVAILWRVQIPRRKKLVLQSLFSATLLIIAFAIIRVFLVRRSMKAKKDISIDWLFFWSLVEMSVAIMVASVASFRQLFVSQGDHRSYGSRPDSVRQAKTQSSSNSSFTKWVPVLRRGTERVSDEELPNRVSTDSEGQTHIIPKNAIHVERTVDLRSEPVSRDGMLPQLGITWGAASAKV